MNSVASKIPRVIGVRIPASETEAALRRRWRMRLVSNAVPTRNMERARPTWLTVERMFMDAPEGKAWCCRAGSSTPKREGPSKTPAIISPTTWAWPNRRVTKHTRRQTPRIMAICTKKRILNCEADMLKLLPLGRNERLICWWGCRFVKVRRNAQTPDLVRGRVLRAGDIFQRIIGHFCRHCAGKPAENLAGQFCMGSQMTKSIASFCREGACYGQLSLVGSCGSAQTLQRLASHGTTRVSAGKARASPEVGSACFWKRGNHSHYSLYVLSIGKPDAPPQTLVKYPARVTGQIFRFLLLNEKAPARKKTSIEAIAVNDHPAENGMVQPPDKPHDPSTAKATESQARAYVDRDDIGRSWSRDKSLQAFAPGQHVVKNGQAQPDAFVSEATPVRLNFVHARDQNGEAVIFECGTKTLYDGCDHALIRAAGLWHCTQDGFAQPARGKKAHGLTSFVEEAN